MADARTLLRQQRAARQQQQQKSKPSATPAAAPSSKKRKAVTPDQVEERKRTRTEEDAGVPAGFFDADLEKPIPPISSDQHNEVPAAEPDAQLTIISNPPPQDTAANDELDAFMNEMDQVAETQQKSVNIYSGAVIESAPMTAAEIAAQAREEQSAQRARLDEELEGEHDDAARALQDEFEEMDGLEDRVRRLREQREALRNKPTEVAAVVPDTTQPTTQPKEEQDEGGSESDDDDEDEDWDDWRFRPA
ncbi:unnamed protein product [Periconia digitata]|uniref:Zinc finger protein 830 n=1 Tax=Periconia digitata TaxID=1303443 RepID=A0A9W4UA23_9PLEO|nr:unnamed protein product [Periconia digitata]